ncbi:MAG: ABC transporter substrate-binding protein [Campylobacteraceae bacterium]|nr:ABC transporter substrate-binding protein [Campylobacteraceae bacterium]
MKKLFMLIFISISLFASEKVDKITLSGPFASVSHPFFRMIQTGALNDIAKNVEFKLWKTPDELRALVINGDVDFMALPSNVAANLYNKEQKIKLLNVSIWGILGMISRDKNIKTLADFKGKEIAIPFRADMPDIVFKELLKKQGLDPKKDFKLRYVSSPIDAIQMLILRRVDHALLIEPAISMAIEKSKTYPMKVIAPTLYRSVDLQEEWGRVFKTQAKLPQAGVAVLGKTINQKHIIKRFQEEYKKAIIWYKNNPEEAGVLSAKHLKMLDANAITSSIPNMKIDFVSAQDSKKDLIDFFEILKASNAKTIGGKLPNDAFYYKQ